VCCSVLQCVAECCRVWQCSYPSVLSVAYLCLQYVICCSELQRDALCCSALQCVAV